MKNWVLFLIIVSFSFLSCTRQAKDKSVLKISLPQSSSYQEIKSFLYHEPPSQYQSVGIQSNGNGEMSEPWNSSLNPANLSAIDCYIVLVGGPEAPMKRNSCAVIDSANSSVLYVGRWAGGIPNGGVVSIEVPSGPQREITVVGFKSQNGACRDFRTNMAKSNLSEPFILGKTVTDLSPGTVNVSITASLGAQKIIDCGGPDFDMENKGLYFGDGKSSDPKYSVIITATKNWSDVQDAKGDEPAYAMITEYNTTSTDPRDNPNGIIMKVNTTGNFTSGDEVMVIVMGGNGKLGPITGPNTDDYDACGYRAWQGRYQFARVIASDNPTGTITLTKGTFLDNLWKDADGNGVPYTTGAGSDLDTANTRLIAGANATNFCKIQIVKVMHFYDLELQSPSGALSQNSNFDWTNGGGVMAMRVSGTLDLGSYSISADGAGYQGVANKNGDGINGSTGTCSNIAITGTGGGCGASGGGGGGGHGNQSGNPFDSSGGNGSSGGGAGGHGAGDNCGDGSCFGSLKYKIFMGGAGGGVPGTGGGSGGGIIYIAAQNIIASSGAKITANGNTNGYAGGGAGGSIMLSYKTITNPNNLTLNTNGGGGGSNSGGGGGGRIHVNSCNGQYPAPANLKVDGGTSGGGTGSSNGSTGSTRTDPATCY